MLVRALPDLSLRNCHMAIAMNMSTGGALRCTGSKREAGFLPHCMSNSGSDQP